MALGNSFPTSVETLSKALCFAEERHRIIQNNIANVNTPFYKAKRAPVAEFNAALQKAVKARKSGVPFNMRSTRNIRQTGSGLAVTPVEDLSCVLRHDRNNVSLEKEMHELAENTLMYRTLADLLRKQFHSLRMAISERLD